MKAWIHNQPFPSWLYDNVLAKDGLDIFDITTFEVIDLSMHLNGSIVFTNMPQNGF